MVKSILEPQDVVEPYHHSSNIGPRSRSSKRLVVCTMVALALYLLSGRVMDQMYPYERFEHSNLVDGSYFDWETIKPTKDLKWVPCYKGFKCARLKVPLDYHDHGAGDAAIAMIKYPAKVDPSSDKYKGPVLFNPGGPGGSGVGLISNLGPSFQLIIGGEFDIIGFDPRGVGQTTPVVDVFPLPLERESFGLRYLEAPFINQTSTALSQVMARATLVNQLIEERANVAAQYLNTAVVSTDMLSIVKAHGLDKLQYWGFSYGSVLGNSFATLYPEHVGRLVVDGVVDAEDYYAGLWSTNLRNTDRGLRLVFQQCAESGKECALNAPTAEDVEARYYKILDSLDSKPIIVHADDFSGIVIRKYVHAVMFMALYSPYRTMKLLFEAFRSLEKGDGLPFYRLVGGLIPSLSCNCESKPPPPVGRQEGQDAILCSDAYSIEADHEAMQKHFDHLSKISVFGDIWSEIRMACINSKVRPKWEWHGPITANHTSFPLLMIDNTEDPVTPDAQKMSKAFKGSVVLTQRSAGHCSIAASSICTFKVIRDYFREGVLPEEGTICEIEDHMFLVGGMEEYYASLSEEDRNLFDSVRELSQKFPISPWPHRKF